MKFIDTTSIRLFKNKIVKQKLDINFDKIKALASLTGTTINIEMLNKAIPSVTLTDRFGEKEVKSDIFLNVNSVVRNKPISGITVYYQILMQYPELTCFTTSFSRLFVYYKGEYLDLELFDTSNVIVFSDMFNNCSKLKEVNMSSFDTSNVITMDGMFFGCTQLLKLDFSNFNTSNVLDMALMFAGCVYLQQLNVSSFDTSKVENMSSMFNYCSTITNLDLSSFDTSNVVGMSSMFSDCENLINLDLSNFNTPSLVGMSRMFINCSKLKSLDVSNFDTSKVRDASSTFRGCKSLKIIKGEFDLRACGRDMEKDMFVDCTARPDKIEVNNYGVY